MIYMLGCLKSVWNYRLGIYLSIQTNIESVFICHFYEDRSGIVKNKFLTIARRPVFLNRVEPLSLADFIRLQTC